MRKWLRNAGFASLVATGLAACTGNIGPGGDGSGEGLDGPGSQALCSSEAPFVVPLQRVNAVQFRRVVAELFGEGLVFDDAFPVPLVGYAYSTYSAANPVADAQVKPLLETAESIALALVPQIPACEGDETACATAYLTDVATRALRRAPADDELAILIGVYSDSRTEMSYEEGVALAVSVLLQMPQFLYVLENHPETGGGVATLDGQEIAQRMALLYWNGLPDTDLLAAADSGALADPEARFAEARRMLDDPKAREVLAGFLREWMMVQGFHATVHDEALQAALDEELRRNIEDALDAEDGLTALLTSNRTWVNSVLEDFYGLPSTSSGPDDWHEAELDPEQRVGILTHPVLLARFAHGEAASVILRGKFVRVNLLCVDIEPPPTGAQDEQAELTPEGSTPKEQAQARLDHPVCGGCHHLMDPIGFGFAAFDGAGRYLPEQGGAAVDVAGEIFPPSDLVGTFEGVRELGERLAEGEEVRSCFARQWVRYSLGKHETDEEACSMGELSLHMASEGASLLDLFASVAAAPAFVDRAEAL